MRKFLLAGAAALTLIGVPAAAQMTDAPEGSTNSVADKRSSYDMTPEQQAVYDTWPEETQTMYVGWIPDYQAYYWTLTPEQQEGYMLLTDEQRMQIYDMTPAQRAAAWTSIVQQMNGQTTAAAASTTASTTATSGNVRFVSNAMVQSTSGDAGPPSGDVPICTANQQDNCINAWEAGKRGPGVTRPLGHWPGKPASEM